MGVDIVSLGEFEIIDRYFRRHARRADVLLGIGDDAAVLDVDAKRKLVVAIDTIVEGVHFPVGTAAADIGYRALAVNLSDLAAMGAEPAWMTLSLSLPHADESWLSGFAAGMFELADDYNVALVGGDTVRGPLVATIQVAGWVEGDSWLTRAGAKPGDLLFVSGVPGEAAAGLAVVQRSIPSSSSSDHLRRRFLRPQPRVDLGRHLRTFASAAMDVSDGLLTDLQKLCAASDCGAELNVDALPASPTMQALFDAEICVEYALAGGDDYEILFTVPAERATLDRIDAIRQVKGRVPVTQIGVMKAGNGVECVRNNQPFRLARGGYDHFAAGEGAQ